MEKESAGCARGVSRRGFLKGGVLAAALGAGAIASSPAAAFGKVPANASSEAAKSSFGASIDEDEYFAKPEAITDVAETFDVDVVVIGAGASGVPAACSAVDHGAKVAVLQKSPRVYGHGIIFAGWNAPSVLEQKGAAPLSEDQIRELKEQYVAEGHYGVQTDLLNAYFAAAPEAMDWHFSKLAELGKMMRVAAQDQDDVSCSYMVFDQVSKAHQAIADAYEQEHGDNIAFYYSTPAMQLVQDDDGAVTGVVAQDRDGRYVQFNSSKGVVIATGGYGANKELVARWLPSCVKFTNGCYPADNTGDGAMMAIWAGADIAPLRSKKIDIRFRGTHSARTDIEKQPFLLINDKGERMGNEGATEMEQNNFVSMNPSASGSYYCIFDSNYGDWLSSIGQDRAILDDEKVEEYEGFAQPLLWQADTIEDLAAKIKVDPDVLKATCDRYTTLAQSGYDEDFYKDSKYLYEIATPPFYAMIREYTIGGTLGCVKVDASCNAVSRKGGVIPGLYVVGNDMGGLQTGQDYVWHDFGMTLGSAVTFGYMVGKNLATA